EILSFMLIPVIAKYCNHYTAIAPAAATSEDTTLPVLIKYTSEEVVVMAVINGVVCSMMVPILINFFYNVL
ncbi:MAG: LysO family transporter, partial [Niameybacter sp.]